MSDLFRKKSMDKVQSPEQLNDYIRISGLGVWMVLAAVILLLLGVCVWGIFGHLDTTIETVAFCKDGVLTCYVDEADASLISETTLVSVQETEYPLEELSDTSAEFSQTLYAEQWDTDIFDEDDNVYTLTFKTPLLADGRYTVSVIVRREKLISFVLE